MKSKIKKLKKVKLVNHFNCPVGTVIKCIDAHQVTIPAVRCGERFIPPRTFWEGILGEFVSQNTFHLHWNNDPVYYIELNKIKSMRLRHIMSHLDEFGVPNYLWAAEAINTGGYLSSYINGSYRPESLQLWCEDAPELFHMIEE